MTKSESIANLAKALNKFQGLGIKVGKEASNPFFKSKYASLANILDTIAKPLSECGLSFSQFPDGKSLTTLLVHSESGEWIEATYEMPIAKPNDPQAVGSAITYARRYAIGAILGLNIDDDDDGNAAAGNQTHKEVLRDSHPRWDEVVKFLAEGNPWSKVEQRFVVTPDVRSEMEADIARYLDPTGHGLSASASDISKKVKKVAG